MTENLWGLFVHRNNVVGEMRTVMNPNVRTFLGVKITEISNEKCILSSCVHLMIFS